MIRQIVCSVYPIKRNQIKISTLNILSVLLRNAKNRDKYVTVKPFTTRIIIKIDKIQGCQLFLTGNPYQHMYD